jgi:hypothetical protein
MARPSKAEQKLIDFSREAFGEYLSALLLSGYGDDHALSSQDYAVELAEGETDTQLQLMFVAEGPSTIQPSLPRRKEPLVLLALLRMLMKRGADLTDRLSYRHKEVLKLLGWGDTTKDEGTLTEAVTKYFHVFYQLNVSHEQSGSEGSDSTYKLRIISSYTFNSGDGSKAGKAAPDSITFCRDFVEHLCKRKLLGIDWERVKGLTPLPSEFFNL